MLYVEAKSPVTTTHDTLGKIEFKVETPKAQTIEEAKTMCGGEDALLEFFNGQLSTNSKNAARAYARNFEVPKDTAPEAYAGLVKQVETKGQQLARDYSPATDTERGPSQKKKAQAFDQLDALLKSDAPLTREKLMELLGAAK